MKHNHQICDGAGTGEHPVVSPRAAAFFDKVLGFAIADGIDADDELATTARLNEAKREWDEIRNRAAKFWAHFQDAAYLNPTADAPLSYAELFGNVITGKDEELLFESELVGNKLATAYLYRKAAVRLAELVGFRELKEKRAEISRQCSENGKKGAREKKKQLAKDEVRNEIIKEVKRLLHERDDKKRPHSGNNSNNAIIKSVLRKKGCKDDKKTVEKIRKVILRGKQETRGRNNRNRQQTTPKK